LTLDSRLPDPVRKSERRDAALLWWVAALAGFCVLPWYLVEDGLFTSLWWLDGYPFDTDVAPALFLILQGEKLWLVPLGALLIALAKVALATPAKADGEAHTSANAAAAKRRRASWLVVLGAAALAWIALQGFSIGLRGWSADWLTALFGPLDDRQFGMGYGALVCATASLFLVSTGLAGRGAVDGDAFVVGSIAFIIGIVGLFIFFPIGTMLSSALGDQDGAFAPLALVERLSDRSIWGLGCLGGGRGCGAAWNSLVLALLVGLLSTALGLVFALVATRSGFRSARFLRPLTVLPIITPPFVIGLAIILLFGLSGTVTTFVAELLDVRPTRWIYGLPGVLIAQLLAFTPIAFLVLIGVVEAVSPSMEEAAQTLRATRWHTFRTVTLPLMRPGLANAFLLGFIESMADFGNPLVLGGNFDVLSTEIFFAIVGARSDQGEAATLALVLLLFTLSAFWAQRRWLGKRSYITRTGKGDAGVPVVLPRRVLLPCWTVAIVWSLFTLIVYGMIVYGSFVQLWGLDHTLTLRHYIAAFGIEGGRLVGGAWDSLITTLQVAAISAPPTAIVGLVTAYLLVRRDFRGKDAFEFGTMLSFAIPGTVIGVSYILAFNVPPLELTGTAIILIISFVFRNMPVGVRAGIASMSQLDRSLDEASLTLGASTFRTFTRIVLPLMRPAILAALVFSFVRAMTAISAVIFLVSAEHNLATSYIIGRVENNDYGIAIAYSTTLIVVMLVVVVALQLLVGRTRVSRRAAQGVPA